MDLTKGKKQLLLNFRCCLP